MRQGPIDECFTQHWHYQILIMIRMYIYFECKVHWGFKCVMNVQLTLLFTTQWVL